MKIKTITEIIETETEVDEKIYLKKEYPDETHYSCIIFNEDSVEHTEISLCVYKNAGVFIDINLDQRYDKSHFKLIDDERISKEEFIDAYDLALSKISAMIYY